MASPEGCVISFRPGAPRSGHAALPAGRAATLCGRCHIRNLHTMKHASSLLRRAALALVTGLTAAAALAQTTPLPVAPVRTVTDTYFGTRVDDPYRYFENKQDPEVAKWM